MQARIYSSASPFSSVFPLGFWPCGGLRLGLVRFFKPFRPLALAQQAQAAIVFIVLRRLGGAALFHSSCPSPNSSYSFWLLVLTFRSSRPAFCGRLTSPVSLRKTRNIEAHVLFTGVYLLKRLFVGFWVSRRASPWGAALVSSIFGL